MKKTTSPIFLKLKIIGVIAFIVILGGMFLFKYFRVSPQVALVSTTNVSSCLSNIESFVASDSCSAGMARKVEYVCTAPDSKGYEGGGANDCMDVMLAYRHAQTFCGQTCPTTMPAPTSYPVLSSSTPMPSPSIKSSPKPVFTSTPTPKPTPIVIYTPKPTARPVPVLTQRCIKVAGRQICWKTYVWPTAR